jgi:hypothetical protein
VSLSLQRRHARISSKLQAVLLIQKLDLATPLPFAAVMLTLSVCE